jgi:hypothetical protein
MADDAVRAGMPVAGQLVFRAVEEIIDLLEVLSDERPLLLELDDLHWADGSTLTAVLWAERCARRLATGTSLSWWRRRCVPERHSRTTGSRRSWLGQPSK